METDTLVQAPPGEGGFVCLLCGQLSSKLVDTEGHRIWVKEEDDTEGGMSRNLDWESQLFHCFFKALKLKPSMPRKYTWNLGEEPVPFCNSCESQQLSTLLGLQMKLESIQKEIAEAVSTIKEKMGDAEKQFQKDDMQVYKKDKRYYWVRFHALGKQVGSIALSQEGAKMSTRKPGRLSKKSKCPAAEIVPTTVLISKTEKEKAEKFKAAYSSIASGTILPTSAIDQETGFEDSNFDTGIMEYDDSLPPSPRIDLPSAEEAQLKSTELNLRKRSSRVSRKAYKFSESDLSSESELETKRTRPIRPKVSNNPESADEDYEPPAKGELFLPSLDKKAGRYGVGYSKLCDEYRHRGVGFKKIGDELFKCVKCGDLVTARRGIIAHVQLHKRTRKCDICGKWALDFKLHKWTHKNAEEKREAIASGEAPPKYAEIEEDADEIVQCEHCGTIVKSQGLLRNHLRNAHPQEYKELLNLSSAEDIHGKDDGGDVKLVCAECGKVFKTERSFKRHMKFHNPEELQFVCVFCDKRFISQKLLNKHKVIHQEKEGFYHLLQCEVCSKKFADQLQYKKHINLHNNVRPFQCTGCPMAFASKPNLDKHFRNYHVEGSNPGRKTYIRGVTGVTKRLKSTKESPQITTASNSSNVDTEHIGDGSTLMPQSLGVPLGQDTTPKGLDFFQF